MLHTLPTMSTKTTTKAVHKHIHAQLQTFSQSHRFAEHLCTYSHASLFYNKRMNSFYWAKVNSDASRLQLTYFHPSTLSHTLQWISATMWVPVINRRSSFSPSTTLILRFLGDKRSSNRTNSDQISHEWQYKPWSVCDTQGRENAFQQNSGLYG